MPNQMPPPAMPLLAGKKMRKNRAVRGLDAGSESVTTGGADDKTAVKTEVASTPADVPLAEEHPAAESNVAEGTAIEQQAGADTRLNVIDNEAVDAPAAATELNEDVASPIGESDGEPESATDNQFVGSSTLIGQPGLDLVLYQKAKPASMPVFDTFENKVAEWKTWSTQGATAILNQGRILIEVRDASAHGDFTPFLERVGCEETQARRLINIAESQYAAQLAPLGPTKGGYLAARFKKDATSTSILADPSFNTMSMSDFRKKLNPNSKKKAPHKQHPENDPRFRAAHDAGLEAGVSTPAWRSWAVGVLWLDQTVLAAEDLIEQAEASCSRLQALTSNREDRQRLREALALLVDGDRKQLRSTALEVSEEDDEEKNVEVSDNDNE
jgi:hypothetical protein